MDVYSPALADAGSAGRARNASTQVTLEKLHYQMEEGRRSLSAFQLSIQLEELVEHWAWSLTGGPSLSLSESTAGLEMPVSARASRSFRPSTPAGLLQALQVEGNAQRIELTGHILLGGRGGWFQARLRLEDGIDCLFVCLEDFLQLGPATFALHELPGVPAELLEGGSAEFNRIRFRPVPMLRKAARAEGVTIPVQPGPFQVHASVHNTLLRVEGVRLESGGTQSQPVDLDAGLLSRELLESLHAHLAAQDWAAFRSALQGLEHDIGVWQKAFELLVLHCPELAPHELRLARRLASTGSPSLVAALVAAHRRAGENLRAAWWLRRLARLNETFPLGRAALRAAEALEAEEGGLPVPSYAELPALMVREPAPERARAADASTTAAPEAVVRGAGVRGEGIGGAASSPWPSTQPPAQAVSMATRDRRSGSEPIRPEPVRPEPVRPEPVRPEPVRVGAAALESSRSAPPEKPAASVGVSTGRSSPSAPTGRTIPEPPSQPSAVAAQPAGDKALDLDALRAQYEAAEDWRGLLAALEQRLELASEPDARLRIHQELARVKLGLGVPSRAVPHFEAVLQLAPGHSEAISFLRAHYSREGQHVPRLTLEARLAKELEPREACKALIRLADEAERLHLLELTRSLLVDASAQDPTDVGLLERLTSLLEPLEAWEALVVAWRRHLPLVAGSKDKVAVGLRIARYLLRQGDLGGAERLFRGVLRSDVEQPEAIEGLADVLEARGAWAEVAELWQRRSRQLQGFERMTAALKLSELFARSLSDLEAADAWFQEAMIEAPRDSRSLNVILKHLGAKSDWKTLARFLEQRWETADTPADRHELLLHLGDVYLVRLQDPTSARACFQKAEAFARAHRLTV